MTPFILIPFHQAGSTPHQPSAKGKLSLMKQLTPLLRGFHAHSDETSRGVPYSVLCFVSKGEEVFLNLSRRMGCSRGTRKQAEEHQYCSSIKINDDALGGCSSNEGVCKRNPSQRVFGLCCSVMVGDSTMVVIGFLKEDCKVLEVRDDREGKPCAVGLMPSIVPLQVDQVVAILVECLCASGMGQHRSIFKRSPLLHGAGGGGPKTYARPLYLDDDTKP
ncbi:hypothetical protein CK203_103759 [Vitis vinifera]|uniref:Uncharacterized protein n=1 Tax=Vitis vinifera TaxID=29760 RepID=A0A438EL84_VITVI|nr:hypothetical protein CK203_103759 [Vitis vinifera]